MKYGPLRKIPRNPLPSRKELAERIDKALPDMDIGPTRKSAQIESADNEFGWKVTGGYKWPRK